MTDQSFANNLRLGTVLIAEDEVLVSIVMEELLRDLGAEDVSVHADAASALETARSGAIDCAILDLVLRDGTSDAIADALCQRGIPFVFSTGSGLDRIPERHRDRPVLNKPFGDSQLREGLATAMRHRVAA